MTVEAGSSYSSITLEVTRGSRTGGTAWRRGELMDEAMGHAPAERRRRRARGSSSPRGPAPRRARAHERGRLLRRDRGRRRIGRLPARRPPLGERRPARPPPGGRTRLPVAGGLSRRGLAGALDGRHLPRPPQQLELRGRAVPGAHLLSARARAHHRRLERGQRHLLHSRAAAGLRQLGGRRQRPLVLRAGAAVLQAQREGRQLHRRLSRRGRPDAGRAPERGAAASGLPGLRAGVPGRRLPRGP